MYWYFVETQLRTKRFDTRFRCQDFHSFTNEITKDHWNWLVEKLSEEELAKVILIMWNIWSYRNKISASNTRASTDVFQK